MTVVTRLMVWIIGSLSTAVLLRLALEPRLLPPPLQALEVYDGAVRAAFAWVEPLLTPHLPMLYRAIGAGTQLQPHWPHVFLIAALAMAPRAEREPGLAAGASLTLRLFQAAGAAVLALAATTYVGTAPFLQANMTANFVVAVFIVSALMINLVDDAFDAIFEVDESSDAPPQSGERRRWLAMFVLAVGLTLVFIALIAGLLRLTDVATTERNVWGVFLLALALIWAFAFWRNSSADDDEPMLKRGFLAAPLTVTARLVLLFTVFPLSSALMHPIVVARGVLFIALAFLAAFFGSRKVLDMVLRRKGERLPPSALGVFLLGGGGLLIVQSWLG